MVVIFVNCYGQTYVFHNNTSFWISGTKLTEEEVSRINEIVVPRKERLYIERFVRLSSIYTMYIYIQVLNDKII